MSKMIQIRDVPDDLHARLKAHAKLAGMSLSDFLKQELGRIAGTVSWREILSRPLDGNAQLEDILEGIREGREHR